jgi:phosphoglycerate kinase
LIEAGFKIICASHLGRPKGKRVESLSLRPVALVLESHLRRPVSFVEACRGEQVSQAAAQAPPGSILMLENLRFEAGEERDDADLARDLAAPASIYVNDAFGAAHRAHASTHAITRFLSPCVAGLLMEEEIAALSRLQAGVRHPYVAILGGAKISGKIELIAHLLERVDRLLIGGAMAYTFLRARGLGTGLSLVEDDQIPTARDLLEQARARRVPVLLPVDHMVAPSLEAERAEATPGEDIPSDRLAGDIGPRSVAAYVAALADASTILWNGPLGAFEHPVFATGTRRVGAAVATCPGFTLVGGGDTAAAAEHLGLSGFGHVSTGGGATLEFLSGLTLPGLAALDDREG